MRPDAMDFTPRRSSSTLGSSDVNSLAMVPVGNGTSDSDDTRTSLHALIDDLYIKNVKVSPREMILHESIKGLLESVATLQTRRDGLEAANVNLKNALEVVESRSASTNSTGMAIGNLTGYASSDAGSENERERSPPKDVISEKLRAQEEFLTRLYEEFQKQAASQQDIDKRFEHKGYDQTALKGRVGTLEKALKELRADFEDGSVHDTSNSFARAPKSDVGTYLNGEVEQVQMRLTNLENKLNEKCDELDSRCESLTIAIEATGTEAPAVGFRPGGSVSSSDDMNGKAPKASKQDIVDLRKWQSTIRRQMNNISLIDDAHTRDALYGMFFHSTHIMEKDSGSYTVWCEGDFEATADEGFALRARVVRRLAMLDLCDAAFKEAQSKWGQIDY